MVPAERVRITFINPTSPLFALSFFFFSTLEYPKLEETINSSKRFKSFQFSLLPTSHLHHTSQLHQLQ